MNLICRRVTKKLKRKDCSYRPSTDVPEDLEYCGRSPNAFLPCVWICWDCFPGEWILLTSVAWHYSFICSTSISRPQCTPSIPPWQHGWTATMAFRIIALIQIFTFILITPTIATERLFCPAHISNEFSCKSDDYHDPFGSCMCQIMSMLSREQEECNGRYWIIPRKKRCGIFFILNKALITKTERF